MRGCANSTKWIAMTTQHPRLKTLVVGSLLDNDGAPLCHPFGAPMDTHAVLQYTGVTTGAPKGAMLTHAIMMDACSSFCETTTR